MGESISAIKAQQDANNVETKEKLALIHRMMINKVAATSANMHNKAIEDKSLPIVAVVDTSEEYKLKVTVAPDKDVSKGIDDILSGNFLGGLKSLITVGLSEFLGNTSAGETEKNDFHVIFANNSLLRLDYMMYKYTFSSTGLVDDYVNAFCYHIQVGVLDLEKVNPQILLYELTRAIGESNLPAAARDLAGLAKFAKDLYSTVHELEAAVFKSGGGAGESGGESGGSGGESGDKTKQHGGEDEENETE